MSSGLGSAGNLMLGSAPATGGLSLTPLLISALLSFAPGLLSKLFGGKSPQQQAMDKIRALYDPAYRAQLQGQFYQQNLSSPAYSQAQGTIAAGANQSAGQLASALGQTGLTPSGTGAIMSSMIPSMVGHNLAGLRTTAYNSAGSAADTSIEGMVRALMGTQGPSQSSQLFAGGLDAFGPVLTAWLKSKYPQFGAGFNPQKATV